MKTNQFIFQFHKKYLFFCTFLAGCELPQWKGDGFCDDGNNNKVCEYDGGDCCGSNVKDDYCSECLCLEPEGK